MKGLNRLRTLRQPGQRNERHAGKRASRTASQSGENNWVSVFEAKGECIQRGLTAVSFTVILLKIQTITVFYNHAVYRCADHVLMRGKECCDEAGVCGSFEGVILLKARCVLGWLDGWQLLGVHLGCNLRVETL